MNTGYYPGKHGRAGYDRYGVAGGGRRKSRPAPAPTWFALVSAWTFGAYYGHMITADERREMNDLARDLDAAAKTTTMGGAS